MGRKRIELPPALEAEIAARTARGESAETVFQAIHGAISRKTIERRQRELRSGARPAKAAPPAPAPATSNPSPETPDVPETIPDGTPLETIDRWLKRVETAASKAEKDGNLAALSSLAMRAASLTEARRKAMPLPKPDPNESPDFKELAKQGEARLLALVRDLFSPQPDAERLAGG